MLFNIYVDDLVQTLTHSAEITLAYADDIVIGCTGTQQLTSVISVLEDWASANNIELNKQKSAVMELKPDGKCKDKLIDRFMGFPTVKSYKYLGLQIDNDSTLSEDTRITRQKEKKWTRLIQMTWAKKLPGKLRFETWRQLVLARFNYSKDLACIYSEKVWTSLRDFYFRSIKSLLNVKSNVNKISFLREVMGTEFKTY